MSNLYTASQEEIPHQQTIEIPKQIVNKIDRFKIFRTSLFIKFEKTVCQIELLLLFCDIKIMCFVVVIGLFVRVFQWRTVLD